MLFRTDEQSWMIHRADPPPAGWEPLPELVRPMLCRAGTLPADAEGWSTEFKWDGVRAMLYVEGGHVLLRSRNDLDVTAAYPELHGLGPALGPHPAIIDGEVVVFDDRGRPSFERLQQRMHVRGVAAARRLAQTLPVSYLAFDVVHLDGHSTIDLPYRERRALLESLGLTAEHWATPAAYAEAPAAVMSAALGAGLEGVVCKRTESRYQPGRRSDDWVKVRGFRTQEVVVGGYTSGQGNRLGTLGALMVGIPEPGGLRYVGKVGTGFSEAHLRELRRLFAPLVQEASPFLGPLPRSEIAGAVWLRPSLVGEVRFSDWTAGGRLRQPVWRGLRPDKSPAEVVAES